MENFKIQPTDVINILVRNNIKFSFSPLLNGCSISLNYSSNKIFIYEERVIISNTIDDIGTIFTNNRDSYESIIESIKIIL